MLGGVLAGAAKAAKDCANARRVRKKAIEWSLSFKESL